MTELLSAVRDRALKRPWLLAPPVLGVVLLEAVGSPLSDRPSGVIGALVMTALATSAVTAAFAELWLGDGRSVEPKRLLSAWWLYLIPYPLLLVAGGLAARAAYSSDVPAVIYAMLGVSKLVGLALGAASTLAVSRRAEGAGLASSLAHGFASAARGIAFLGPMLLGVWAVQELLSVVTRTLAPGPIGAFTAIAVPLLGCVALPLEARRAGRLK